MYTLRTHCDTLRKLQRAAVTVCAGSAAWAPRVAKLGAAAASATEHDDVKTVGEPAVAGGIARRRRAARCSGDEGVSSGARERRAPDPREARGVGGAAAPHPAVARPQELRFGRAYFASASLWTLEAGCALGAAAACAPRLATDAEPTRLASFWHVHLLRALRCSGSVTHSQSTRPHAADERRRVLCWPDAGVGGAAARSWSLFDG